MWNSRLHWPPIIGIIWWHFKGTWPYMTRFQVCSLKLKESFLSFTFVIWKMVLMILYYRYAMQMIGSVYTDWVFLMPKSEIWNDLQKCFEHWHDAINGSFHTWLHVIVLNQNVGILKLLYSITFRLCVYEEQINFVVRFQSHPSWDLSMNT